MSIKEISACFMELEGLTLQWYSTVLGHSVFIFRSVPIKGRYVQLRFWMTRAIDVANVMHNCRLRMATVQENDQFRQHSSEYLNNFENFPKEMGYSMDDNRVIIECEEGNFSILALELQVSWMKEADQDSNLQLYKEENPYWNINAPLWPGGPAFADL